jgi:hypothetical protein
MMTFLYKESLELIINTLKNVAQMNGSHNFIVVIGIEEKAPDRATTIEAIVEAFGGKFLEMIITVHPFGVEGEIPGKCSNSNYA